MSAPRRWLAANMDGRQAELVQHVIFGILEGISWSMVVPMMSLFARHLGATDFQLGIVSIIPALITIALSVPGNALSLRYGRRTSFAASFVLGAISAGLFFSAGNLWVFAVAQLFFGMANTLFWPAQFAALTEIIPPRNRTHILGYAMAVSNIGTIFGSMLSGVLVDHFGFPAVYVIYFVTSLVSLSLVPRMRRGEFDPTISLLGTILKGNSGVGTLLPRPTIMVTALNTLALAVNQGITDYFVPVFLKEVGYTATFVGTAATLKTTGLVLVRFGLGALTKSIGAFTLLFLGVATATAAMAAIPLFPVAPYILLAYFLTGAGSGMAPVLTSALIAEATKSTERGLGMALDQTASNSGRVTSGLGFGAFAQAFGLSATVIMGNGLVLVAMGGIVALHRKLTKRPARVSSG